MKPDKAENHTLAGGISRRDVLGGAAGAVLALATASRAHAAGEEFRFGLTPVFRSDDLVLLDELRTFLEASLQQPVSLITRRTYQEITSLLVSGQCHAAWICGYPFVQHRQQLALVAVPVWQGQPLYRSYLIAAEHRQGNSIDDLRGDIHAFSDPNSNSGYLVTRTLLARRHIRPEDFFRKSFFTYGHRNVIRSVAVGLANSGSVDGYVWEVVAQQEPELTAKTRVISKSELMGFPPIACATKLRDSAMILKFKKALIHAHSNPQAQKLLSTLRLDGLTSSPASLFDSIAAEVEIVRGLG